MTEYDKLVEWAKSSGFTLTEEHGGWVLVLKDANGKEFRFGHVPQVHSFLKGVEYGRS